MQRKSEELQLAVQEYLDVDWTSVKFYLRRQIAKCVQECKSQASNAKRIAKTLKPSHSSHSHTSESNGTCDSWDDSDDWGSDFEDESEDDDDVKEEHSFSEVNNNSIIQSVSGILEKPSSNTPVLPSNTLEEKSIPKPPDVPVISKTVNGISSYKNNSTNSIPRPPLKRPPSQPPPPPVSQASSHIEPQEDYEIPIIHTTNGKDSYNFSDSTFVNSTSNEATVIETYEIVEPPEENYEMVDPPHQNMSDKPILPPRLFKAPPVGVSPPPLPQKPQKLKEISGSDRPEGVRTFSRPKLPLKFENDVSIEIVQPSSLPSNVGFINSLIGRRGSTTPTSSPKILHKSKDSLNSFGTSPIPSNILNDSISSTSSSPDRDSFMTVGNSAFLNSGSSVDVKKTQPLPPLPPRGVAAVSEDTVQNMATRPLPPVPVPKSGDKCASNTQPQDIQQCPWFHEIEREEAEAAVKKINEGGSFVVRPSKRAGKDNPYSLTVLHEEKLFHLNIRLRADNTFALGKEKEKEKTFATVIDLITFHLNEPILLKNRGESAGKTILRKYPEKT
ncbi:hypothetical protein CDAR_409252 [Caerostris darwini]|uniref:SH2 domain-containing protein n=1 Tax=Caerostris darwini TaxID=1538125 RepID=A0AAV4UCU1_9ARAC|nr:hypothetical protein CDAR_409252 [Caerostris darwini]